MKSIEHIRMQRARLIAAIMIGICVTTQIPAQEIDTDPDRASFVQRAGGARQAADSCRNVLAAVARRISETAPAASPADNDSFWFSVNCAQWIGALGGAEDIPVLDAIIAVKRDADDQMFPSGFMRQFQEYAFNSRVALMLASGKRSTLFNELIATFGRGANGTTETMHDGDLLEWSEVNLAMHDEFIGDLFDYARRTYLPIPSLPAQTIEEEQRYTGLMHFLRLIDISTDVKRKAVINLLQDMNADVRQLGVMLIDRSPSTVDALIALHSTAAGEIKTSLRRALETVRDKYRRSVTRAEQDRAGLAKDSPRWKAMQKNIDSGNAMVQRIQGVLE